MPIPLYGFMEGDTVGLLILADEDETLQSLGWKLQEAARLRVAPRDPFRLICDDRAMDLKLTVAQSGLQALDRFDVVSA